MQELSITVSRREIAIAVRQTPILLLGDYNSVPSDYLCLLENQTVRMIESLRRWGGRLRESPIFAVTPRIGPPLSRQTHRSFERLGVEYLRFQAEKKRIL